MKTKLLGKKILAKILFMGVLITSVVNNAYFPSLAISENFNESVFENFQNYSENYSAENDVTPSISDINKKWIWNKTGSTGNLSINAINTDFAGIGGTKSIKFGFDSSEKVLLNNPTGDQRFDYSMDGISFWANADTDNNKVFKSDDSITTNTAAAGLKDANSKSSVKIVLPGWGYPKYTFAGDLSENKFVSFWILVKTNQDSNGFAATDIPISNMINGATLGTAKLNEWVHMTIDLNSMNSYSFGFLQDRAPLNVGSLDIYLDYIEFSKSDNDYNYFTINGFADYMENTESIGLHNADSSSSAKVALGGWGFPTLQINKDVSNYIAIRFWALAKENQFSNGFAGPDVPINNMSTGALLGTAKFDEWIQITINISDMSNNSFGFLCDRAPLNQGGLDLYIDNVEFIENDGDVSELFSVSGPISVNTNTNSTGLYGVDSTSSVRFNLGGYSYPAITVKGDMSSKKSIRFWAIARTNLWSAGYEDPDVPISNMATGATLANVKLNEWVQITINFSDISGNTFGFLQDREPLANHSLDIYMDNIELLDADGNSLKNAKTNGLSYLKMSVCSKNGDNFSTNVQLKSGWNKYYVPYQSFEYNGTTLRALQETENYFYNLNFEFYHNISGELYTGDSFQSYNSSLLFYIDNIGFYSGNTDLDSDTQYITSELSQIYLGDYTVQENNVIVMQAGITNGAFIASLNRVSGTEINISNTEDGTSLGTGSTIDVLVNNEVVRYTALIFGDLNGDGSITIKDLILTKNSMIGKAVLVGLNLQSADFNQDGVINNICDLLMIKSHILDR